MLEEASCGLEAELKLNSPATPINAAIMLQTVMQTIVMEPSSGNTIIIL